MLVTPYLMILFSLIARMSSSVFKRDGEPNLYVLILSIFAYLCNVMALDALIDGVYPKAKGFVNK